jgi:hypothetical protein
VVGELRLEGGGEIQLRAFGRFNITLWDDVMEELGGLRQGDVLMVNFAAWYHRFFFDGGPREWDAWRDDVYELVMERLANSPAQVGCLSQASFLFKTLKRGSRCPETRSGCLLDLHCFC